MDQATMLKAMKAFPSLAKNMQEYGEPDDAIGYLQLQSTGDGGMGRKAAAEFLLHMWRERISFNLRAAWGVWDKDHRAAFFAFMQAG